MCRHSLVLLTFTLNTLHQALDHHNTASFTEYAFTSYHSQSRTHGNQASMHKHLDHVESTLNKEERKNHVSIPLLGRTVHPKHPPIPSRSSSLTQKKTD